MEKGSKRSVVQGVQLQCAESSPSRVVQPCKTTQLRPDEDQGHVQKKPQLTAGEGQVRTGQQC